MTWGWNGRGSLPVDVNASGSTGGGNRGSWDEAGVTQAWPRYEAQYLKRSLLSDQHKYDAASLDDVEKQVYLSKVTSKYKEEADECLKAEFDQWLQGTHEVNDPKGPREYENGEGRPIRRWVMRTEESEDQFGGSKVGQARSGWEHTPWGRATLTGLPGVRDYLRLQKERANNEDLKMQLLAEYGPQNLDEAWKYFKHWVKGRPVSDALCLPAHFDHIAAGARSDFGNNQPQMMKYYDPDPHDAAPHVAATDRSAYNGSDVSMGHSNTVQEARNMRHMLENMTLDNGNAEADAREKQGDTIMVENERIEKVIDSAERSEQHANAQSLSEPVGLDILS